MMFYIAIGVVSLVLLLSLFSDIKSFRIRNIVTLPTALIGLILNFFMFPWLSVVLFFVVLLGVGIIGEILNLWKTGDTKLILATGIWSSFIIGSPKLLFALGFYLTFIVLHMIIGHLFGLKKYKFNIKNYLLSLKTGINESYGRFSGAITITIALLVNILSIF